jgi:hypothetical protein
MPLAAALNEVYEMACMLDVQTEATAELSERQQAEAGVSEKSRIYHWGV